MVLSKNLRLRRHVQQRVCVCAILVLACVRERSYYYYNIIYVVHVYFSHGRPHECLPFRILYCIIFLCADNPPARTQSLLIERTAKRPLVIGPVKPAAVVSRRSYTFILYVCVYYYKLHVCWYITCRRIVHRRQPFRYKLYYLYFILHATRPNPYSRHRRDLFRVHSLLPKRP